jgi:hypothetical protein
MYEDLAFFTPNVSSYKVVEFGARFTEHPVYKGLHFRALVFLVPHPVQKRTSSVDINRKCTE